MEVRIPAARTLVRCSPHRLWIPASMTLWNASRFGRKNRRMARRPCSTRYQTTKSRKLLYVFAFCPYPPSLTRAQTDIDNLLKEYNVKENLDILHAVVLDATERKKNGTAGNDIWKEDLRPQAAIRARTVPLLEAEAQRLRAMLSEVRSALSYI